MAGEGVEPPEPRLGMSGFHRIADRRERGLVLHARHGGGIGGAAPVGSGECAEGVRRAQVPPLGQSGTGSAASSLSPAPPAPPTAPVAAANAPRPLLAGRAGIPEAGLPEVTDLSAATPATADRTAATTQDAFFGAAERRLLAWLTPDYAAPVSAARPVAAPGADWDRLATTAHGRDGRRGRATTHLPCVRPARPRKCAPWRLSEMRVAQ